jgi:hypothetical protein
VGNSCFKFSNFEILILKYLKKFARHFSDVRTKCEILLPLRLLETHYESSIFVQGRSPGGGGLPGCNPPNPQNRNLKSSGFVDIMVSKVLRDFPFSRNQSLKSADDQYVRILKNIRKLIKLKKKQDDRTL